LEILKVEKTHWTTTDIQKIYHLEERISKQTLLNAEERGEIPKAQRIVRGKVKVRAWKLDQLPDIGKKYGFLSKPKKQLIICVFVQKGGVLKTTTSQNLARILALNGIKTLIIGTDYECSITDLILPKKDIVSLTDLDSPIGLYHYFEQNAPIKDIIVKTNLPTLDIIPETHDLNLLEKKLRHEKRREYLFKDKLLPDLSDYDVIIFDNGPGWNLLIENVLTASTIIISPLGCTLLAYKAVQTNISSIQEFAEEMKLQWQYIMVATLLDNSGISQQIYGRYLDKFTPNIIPTPIRTSSKGQEAQANRQSILEYAPTSNLANDYFSIVTTMWDRLTK